MRLPLTTLEVFNAIAEEGSLKAAAEKLNLKPSTVSHQLKTLERHIGHPLFIRTTRTLNITESGRKLLNGTSLAFSQLKTAVESAEQSGKETTGQLNLSVHVGGLTALRLKGLGHYLPFTKETVYLFSDGREHLPAWFNNYQWSDTISHHNGALFELPARTLLSAHAHKSFEILISSPERAAFEMLSLVKTNDDFDAAMTVYEGLGRLRPRATQQLLEACGSVKVKRMFLWMATHFDHPWLTHVDLSSVDLGKGKRMIYSGGKLDKEYLITVPKADQFHP